MKLSTWMSRRSYKNLAVAMAFGVTFVVSSALVPVDAQATCLTPAGDVTGNGNANVSDAICLLLVSQFQLLLDTNPAGATVPMCLGTNKISAADANCDGSVDVSDAVIVVSLIIGNSLSSTIDSDPADGCVDVCQSVQLPGPPVVVPAFVHGVSEGGGLRLQALGTGASAVGSSTGTTMDGDLKLEPHPIAK